MTPDHLPAPGNSATGSYASVPGNFVRQAIDHDLASGALAGRRWSGHPGVAAVRRFGEPDPATIRTRFPPEPNGYLHIGHAKSICLNFGIAQSYGGRCHMRFDDTNPVKEDQEYVDAILDSIRWLGFEWEHEDGQRDLYFASDYFEQLYDFACYLIEAGHAYVDEQTADEIREGRGTLTQAGRDSPFRDRPAAESLELFRQMREGKHEEGSLILRARIDMRSPNMNLRDPVLYRIRFAHHHRTAGEWSVYPMYDYAHPLSDALEGITHSLCTLEFEDHRPLYDWLIARVAEGGYFDKPLPRQIEFARLNLNYTITSKRRLQQLVSEGHVDGWDDPRMPTLVGLRRRGYTPESIRLFCDRIGVAKAAQWIDMSVLEQAVRDDLDERAGRVSVVIDPVRLVITSLDEALTEPCEAAVHPHHPDRGLRRFLLSRELWMEREDFAEDPPKGFFRMAPDRLVRLRHAYIVKCTGFDRGADGRVTTVYCEHLPQTRSGTPGADSVKVKGNIHWVSAREAVAVELRIYDRLFTEPQPDAGGRDFLTFLNTDSKRISTGYAEPSIASASPEERLQFERQGYFVADRYDHRPERPVFNRVTTLKDSWGKRG
ncbi:MAG TPA: glutamine--tRNA ligase/YqeY domain fusion protein [Lautropia sp.]|nr:glutamine--tRNA ligase/YqeY domain fusion protein [Lautropia sp.]